MIKKILATAGIAATLLITGAGVASAAEPVPAAPAVGQVSDQCLAGIKDQIINGEQFGPALYAMSQACSEDDRFTPRQVLEHYANPGVVKLVLSAAGA